MSLRLAVHWLLYSLLAMACPIAASVALTGPLSAVIGVLTAVIGILTGLATTHRRQT